MLPRGEEGIAKGKLFITQHLLMLYLGKRKGCSLVAREIVNKTDTVLYNVVELYASKLFSEN